MNENVESLYEKIRTEFGVVQHKIAGSPLIVLNLYSCIDSYSYELFNMDGKEIHLLGEKHYSIMPMKYLHENIVPFIEKNPDEWVIFREMLFNSRTNKEISSIPTYYYLKELSNLLEIPMISVLSDISSPETISYIEDKLSCKVDIGAVLSHEYFNILPKRYSTNLGTFEVDRIALISELLDMDLEVVNNYLNEKAPSLAEIIPHWNDLSKERFEDYLGDFSNPKILISVGKAHVPAFSRQ